MYVRIEFYGRLPADAEAIREEVFVSEQGFSHEFDEADARAEHAVAYDGETAVGTLRIVRETPDRVTIGRVAVKRAYRGRKIGKALLEAAFAEARRIGAKTAELFAQEQAVGFYRKSGFCEGDETRSEDGVRHVLMTRAL